MRGLFLCKKELIATIKKCISIQHAMRDHDWWNFNLILMIKKNAVNWIISACLQKACSVVNFMITSIILREWVQNNTMHE